MLPSSSEEAGEAGAPGLDRGACGVRVQAGSSRMPTSGDSQAFKDADS